MMRYVKRSLIIPLLILMAFVRWIGLMGVNYGRAPTDVPSLAQRIRGGGQSEGRRFPHRNISELGILKGDRGWTVHGAAYSSRALSEETLTLSDAVAACQATSECKAVTCDKEVELCSARASSKLVPSATGEVTFCSPRTKCQEADDCDRLQSKLPHFSAAMYKDIHIDLAGMTDNQACRHYLQYGQAEGRALTWATAAMLSEALALTRNDWARRQGANQSGIHFTCMSVFQKQAQQVNTTGFMVQAVETFMSTTRNSSDLWVVDDASTCKVHLQALRSLEQKYSSRLHVHIKPVNGGIAKSKNSCIRMFLDSNAQYLSLVDQDVYFIQPGWQEAYEAGLDCGVDHMQHNLNPPAPATIYGLQCTSARAGQSPRPWWISHATKDENPGVALLHDLVTVGSYGYFYAFNRRLIVLLGGYHIFQHKWGHEHTEYHTRAFVAAKLLNSVYYGRAPLLRLPAVLDILDSSAYIGCHINNGGAFDAKSKSVMAAQNGNEMTERLNRAHKGDFHSPVLYE